MTTNEVMAAVDGTAYREYVKGLGDVVLAKRVAHTCGHREDRVLVPSQLVSEREVQQELTFEQKRDCSNCRFTEFVNFRLGGAR